MYEQHDNTQPPPEPGQRPHLTVSPHKLFELRAMECSQLLKATRAGDPTARRELLDAIFALNDQAGALLEDEYDDHRDIERHNCLSKIAEEAKLVLATTLSQADDDGLRLVALGACGYVSTDLNQRNGFDGGWQVEGCEYENRARHGRLLDADGDSAAAMRERMNCLWRIPLLLSEAGLPDLDYDSGHHLAEILAMVAADFATRLGDSDGAWLCKTVAEVIREWRNPEVFPEPDTGEEAWKHYFSWERAHRDSAT